MTTNEPRSVSELLQILADTGTYQGMTDAEIQSIIDHEKEVSYAQGHANGLQENILNVRQQYETARTNATATALQGQRELLESIKNRASSTQLRVIQYG